MANCLAFLPFSAACVLGLAANISKFLAKWGKLLFLIAIIGTSLIITQPLWSNLTAVAAQNPDQEIQLGLNNQTATLSPQFNVYAVNGRQVATVNSLIRLMAQNGLDFYSIIQPDDVVIIKINEQWPERGGSDTDVLKGLIQAIVDHPRGFVGEIVVADNGQGRGSMNWPSSNAENHSQSTQTVINGFSPSHKVSTYNWQNISAANVKEYSAGDMNDGYVVVGRPDPTTEVVVCYPKFHTVYGTRISFKYGVWNGSAYLSNKLKVINLPVLKTHDTFGATAAIKNYMGVQSNEVGNGHATVGIGGMGTLMVQTRMPALNILCAVWVNAMPFRGPDTLYGEATRTNVLAASTDPLALDYWASKYVLVPASQAIGYSDTSSLDPEAEDGVFAVYLRLSRDAMQRAGYQTVTDKQQINVYVLDSSPSPTPTPTQSPSLSPSPSTPPPTPTPPPTETPTLPPTTPTPTPTPPEPTPTPTVLFTPTPTPTASNTPEPTPTATATPTVTPEPTPSFTLTPQPTIAPAVTPTPTSVTSSPPTSTPTPSTSAQPTQSSPSPASTSTPSSSPIPSGTVSPSPPPSLSPSATQTVDEPALSVATALVIGVVAVVVTGVSAFLGLRKRGKHP
ncbi:MAG: DUF362 domain-containing protein [Candidatus Bathyarchaeia archaeon]